MFSGLEERRDLVVARGTEPRFSPFRVTALPGVTYVSLQIKTQDIEMDVFVVLSLIHCHPQKR